MGEKASSDMMEVDGRESIEWHDIACLQDSLVSLFVLRLLLLSELDPQPYGYCI
jgi:hypothetical protein